MKFPTSLHTGGWQHHRMPLDGAYPSMSLPDDVSPAHSHWGSHVLIALVAVGGVVASAGLAAVDERPLDVQMNSAMSQAGDTLKDWQSTLSHGLQVSMRAVADGSDAPALDSMAVSAAQPVALAVVEAPAEVANEPAVVAAAEDDSDKTQTAALTNVEDRDQPVRPDLQPGTARTAAR